MVPVIWVILSAALGLSAVVVLAAFWKEILAWAEISLFPWFEKNLPDLAPHIRHAFAKLDQAVVSVRRKIKSAWIRIKPHILKAVAALKRVSDSEWVRKFTSWVVKNLEESKPKVFKQVTEEGVDWDRLPDDVRKAWLARQTSPKPIDIVEARDREIGEMELST